ncbi:hypothetical protein H4683_001878 [Filibacter limicola]|uniref:Uncharacterized protein n=1 Tax=Sporosarcina limicola TaxID=34101 RepID=A0A927MI24_9BACL|nr:hypothetical protein [Sporosarcina limicola]
MSATAFQRMRREQAAKAEQEAAIKAEQEVKVKKPKGDK